MFFLLCLIALYVLLTCLGNAFERYDFDVLLDEIGDDNERF